MLQQTQVGRVIPKYEAWMESYPDVTNLAEASFRDVLSHWDGLGYNNRAKWLHRAAHDVVSEHGGELPRDEGSLQELPGIGPYTARAIKIFAFNEDVVTVDTNIRRVLISELGLDNALEEDDLYDVANEVLPDGRSRTWHNALMDYGALVATSHATGISPTSTQDAFEGSVRQARGDILRRLRSGQVEAKTVLAEYPDRGEQAIQGLVDDGLIEHEEGSLRLAESG